MDKRKLKLKSGLHKNLVPESQVTSRSNSIISNISSQESVISNRLNSASSSSVNSPLLDDTNSRTVLATRTKEKEDSISFTDIANKHTISRKRKVGTIDTDDDDDSHSSLKNSNKKINLSKYTTVTSKTSDSDNDVYTATNKNPAEQSNVSHSQNMLNKKMLTISGSDANPKNVEREDRLVGSSVRNTKKKSNTSFLLNKTGSHETTYDNQKDLGCSSTKHSGTKRNKKNTKYIEELNPDLLNTNRRENKSNLQEEVLPAKQKTPSKSQTISDDSDTSPNKLSMSKSRYLESPNRCVQNTSAHCEDMPSSNNSEAYYNMSERLQDFLQICGITLSSTRTFCISEEPLVVKGKMNDLLVSGQFENTDVIKFVEEYIEDDENLQSILNDMEVPGDYRIFFNFCNLSLARLMLQLPALQTGVFTCLVTKLMESLLIVDSVDKVTWRLNLLQQIRFLESVTDMDALLSNVEKLLESCPLTFQKELIIFIPDIVPDAKHHAVAEILCKLMGEEPELISVILDCVAKLTLGKEYFEEFRENVLDLLKESFDKSIIPDIIRFVVTDCPNNAAMKKVIFVLRQTEMQPLAGEKLEECHKTQINIMNALKINILLSKNFVQTIITVIKDLTKDPKPIDIIFLLLIFLTHSKKRKLIESLFKQHIRSGFYRRSLLSLFYNDFQEVARELQPAALLLSSNLLKADNCAYFEFGIEWFRLQFMSQVNAVHKQREIIQRITLLMGSNDQTAKNALRILCKMISKKEEKQALQIHCNHLRILLEKMDNWDLEEVSILCDILHSLCTTANSTTEPLQDDLNILLQKQLSNTKPFTKCKGVLGAVMAIKHLASTVDLNAASMLYKKVLTSVQNCIRSKALFYDQLAQVIEHTENIDKKFLEVIKTHIEEEFITTYMIDISTYNGDLTPQYGLNDAESDSEQSVIYFGNEKYGAIVPISFRLLKTCCIRLSDNGDLEDIDALLGSAILMPQSFDLIEHSATDLLIHCINWFREIIGGFVTQENPLLQRQILKRLDHLMILQSELSTALPLYDTKYQPPLCYFHYFPAPAFLKGEKKSIKKGKKDTPNKSVPSHSESWEVGSALCLKNPTYFRKLNAKIAHLLDVKMEVQLTQTATESISIPQVCFIVKELLGMLENNPTESFIRDLIHLLPKVCAKLQDIVNDLKEHDNNQNKEAARLLICLLMAVLDWKGFQNVTYQMLLREGLRTIAGQINEENAMLRSCKELVAESYKYFETLTEIATKISLAVAIVNTCKVLMKHSTSYTEQNKDKQAKMAFAFLCLEWPDDKHSGATYKTEITVLLNNWIDNEPSPLDTVTTILAWLPDDIVKLTKSQDYLQRIPSISKIHFHLLYKKLFDGVIKGIKISLSSADTDPMRIVVWKQAAVIVQKLADICKTVKRHCIILFLRYMPTLLKLFIYSGMPILEHNLKYQADDITGILKALQGGTRHLHAICCHSEEQKNTSLSKYIPIAKSTLEQLIYSVKGMLVLNNSPSAFWMGNLRNKNLDGQEILSQTSEETNSNNLETMTEDMTNASSDMLDSASDNDIGGSENDEDELSN